jgi:hypothetical protein
MVATHFCVGYLTGIDPTYRCGTLVVIQVWKCFQSSIGCNHHGVWYYRNDPLDPPAPDVDYPENYFTIGRISSGMMANWYRIY